MKPLFPHIDIHCHDHNRGDCAVINISPDDEMKIGAYYSVGIHPWNALDVAEVTLVRLETMCRDSRVVAIGETGLDLLKGPSIDVQRKLFMHHITLSEQIGKPLIIHAVKTIDHIIAVKRDVNPVQPWIIHGFRGKPQQAQQLLQHGFYLSLGQHFNAQTALMIPDDRLFFETDESEMPIEQIVNQINSHRKQ